MKERIRNDLLSENARLAAEAREKRAKEKKPSLADGAEVDPFAEERHNEKER